MWITILTAIIAGGSALFGSFLSHRWMIKKERLSQEFERERQFREKMNEVYVNCLKSLSKIAIHRSAFQTLWGLESSLSPEGKKEKFESEHLKEVLPLYEEARTWLEALLIYYPNKQGTEFDEFNKSVKEFTVNIGHMKLESLRNSVLKLATSDRRFQPQLLKNLENMERGKLRGKIQALRGKNN